MFCVNGNDNEVDFSALDEELFGQLSADDISNYHEETLHHHDTSTGNINQLPGTHDGAARSENRQTIPSIPPQIATTPRSGHYTPPLSLPATPVPSENRYMATELHDTSLDPESFPPIAPPFASDLSQFLENISWMKNRVTDVHQLLLHYLNLRDAHQALASDLQKEVVLRNEAQEALECIREQQDQTSEDFPKLQFQIAQLKLDYQKERTARTVAEAKLVSINEKVKTYTAGYMMMQTRALDSQAKEQEWLKEKAELALSMRNLLAENRRIRLQALPLEEIASPELLAEKGQQEIW